MHFPRYISFLLLYFCIYFLQFIVEAFHPSFENVAAKLSERCNKAVCHNAKIFPHYKPLDEGYHPVMLKFESQIVAMVMVVDKHNPKLVRIILILNLYLLICVLCCYRTM